MDKGSNLEVRFEQSLEDPRSALEDPLVLFPTPAAVEDMTRQFGYTTAMLRPRFASYVGCSDYEHGQRRAFVLAKRSDVFNSSFELEKICSPLPRIAPSALSHGAHDE